MLFTEEIKKLAETENPWERLSGKTLLVSGGTGFLGSIFSEVISYRNMYYGQNITVINLSRHPRENSGNIFYVKQDIAEPFSVAGRVDYILHLASNTHPQQYASDPIGTIMINVLGCQRLLDLAKIKGSRFLLASSVEIYGDGNGVPMNEQYSGYLDCNTVRAGYNEAKRVCESLCQSYRAQYGVNCVIARLARCFGADLSKKDTKAMAQFLDKSANGADIVLHSRGLQRFSYCYGYDAVGGILKILLEGKDGEAYNVSDDDEGKTLGEYAEFIAALGGVSAVYQIGEDAGASKASYAVLDCAKLKALGWEPLYTVSCGLEASFRKLQLCAHGNSILS